MNEDLSTSPLLGLRVLQLLSDVPRDERRAALLNVDDLVAYCAGMAIEPSATYLWLQALLDTQLVLNYDPTVTDVKEARQVEISPSGRLHLYWGQGNHDYMAAMALVTPLLTENVFTEMLAESRNARAWRSVTAKFVRYLLEEDRTYCVISDHEAYQSQKKLCLIIERSADRLENWTSHAQRQPRDRKVDDSAGRRGRPPRVR